MPMRSGLFLPLFDELADPAIVASPELGDQLAAPALNWMHSRGWQRHPEPLCPANHR
jgi:hypothetical protein